MTPLTREWVVKAEGDYATARRELRARKLPNFDAACFHAQQCAEKYLKAFLQENGLAIARSHNLEMLAQPLLEAHAWLKNLAPGLRTLSAYAVETRYPGMTVDRRAAREALTLCTALRTAIRKLLREPK